jgi:hypothetical protein
MNPEYVIDEIQHHINRIEAILPEIESWMPLNIEDFNDTEKVKTIDSFIYRFIKIQDKMGEKLFPSVLYALHEYDSTMPFIDVLNKLEKLRLIPSADEWIEFRNLRNTLTHEYPDNEDEIIQAIEIALDAYKTMLSIFGKMSDELQKRDS